MIVSLAILNYHDVGASHYQGNWVFAATGLSADIITELFSSVSDLQSTVWLYLLEPPVVSNSDGADNS